MLEKMRTSAPFVLAASAISTYFFLWTGSDDLEYKIVENLLSEIVRDKPEQSIGYKERPNGAPVRRHCNVFGAIPGSHFVLRQHFEESKKGSVSVVSCFQ